MSLCLSASTAPLPPSASGGWTGLGARLRRMVLRFAAPEDIGDMLPAPTTDRVAAIRARRDRAEAQRRAAGDEVNALLL